MDFQGFSRFFENLDFRRKMKVAESVQKRFYSIQGMRTRWKTTPRGPENFLLAPQAVTGGGEQWGVTCMSSKVAKIGGNL